VEEPVEGRSEAGVHYETVERSPTAPWVVFVHGMFGRAAWWRPWHAELAQFNLLALDVPGYGASRASEQQLADRTLDEWTGYITGLLDELGLERVFFVGESTGAASVMNTAATRPERVSACVITTSPYRGGTVQGPIAAYAEALDGGGGMAAVADYLLPHVGVEPGSELDAEARRSIEAVDPAVVYADQRLWERTDLEARLGDIRAPFTIIGNGASDFIPRENFFQLERLIPGSRLVLIGDAPHWLAYTHAPEASFLARFFFQAILDTGDRRDR
jgi:pimeloyl-ACP methyl ester carboxylesterase